MRNRTDPAARARGFPPALTSFVGRADEIDRLTLLLRSHRLVTVIGPGGVGKTRLAAEVSHRLADPLDDRIWVVELAVVSAPHQVASAVGARLGIQQHSNRSMVQAVADVLTGPTTLLILDNCEHLLEAVAKFCGELLARCDDVVILATSREQLGVAGEARLRLRPLAARPPDGARAGEVAGVALFVDRVRLTDPAFELSAESAALVPDIVARLDGLPLAIELAAARVESLGMAQLNTRLGAPVQLLMQGARTAPVRHRSLRATVDWSCELLDGPLRLVFRRLAILPGPFTLRAAEAVAGTDTESSILHLVDCSLLTPPRSGPDGRARYAMLETVRAVALEQLDESAEREDTERAMVAFAAGLAAEAAAGMRTAGGEATAAAQLDAEEALLDEALSWALEHDAEAAVRMAVAMAPWWQLRGRALSGYPLLEQALHGYAAHDELSAAAHKWLARLAHSTVAFECALTHFDELCAISRGHGTSQDLVDGLAGKAGSLRNLGRLAEAGDAAHAALHAARELDYAEGEALALTQLSLIEDYADDAEAATRWARAAARVDPARLPDKTARRVRLVLTVALAETDDLETAQETCAAGLKSARAAGDVTMQADFLYFTTHIALHEGRLANAGTHILESLGLTAQSGDSLRVLDCLDDCGRLCAATGRPAEAITLWAAHEAGARTLGTPNLPQDARHRQEPLLQARRLLRPEAVRAAERRGAQMNLQTAAEFAAMLAGSRPAEAHETGAAAQLTPRERELLVLVAQGRTDAQIAAELFISIRTVRSHLDRIRDKTGSRRRADLTMLALRAGLI